MLENLDPKLVLAVFTTVLLLAGFYRYFIDIFKKKTKPHLYTWLIWAITQGTATIALIHGGGNWGAISLIVSTVLVVIIFFLSFKYGTTNITKNDTFVLIIALLAIFIWWRLNNPLIAVLMVSAIDGLGYFPTFRKSFQEPYSETLTYWAIMAISSVLAIISNAEYNLLTVTYLAVLALANTTVWTICFVRRRVIKKDFINKQKAINIV